MSKYKSTSWVTNPSMLVNIFAKENPEEVQNTNGFARCIFFAGIFMFLVTRSMIILTITGMCLFVLFVAETMTNSTIFEKGEEKKKREPRVTTEPLARRFATPN